MGVTTLAQLAIPSTETVFSFILLFGGAIVLILLLYLFIAKRDLSPYTGMPALIALVIMLVLLLGGQAIDLVAMPEIVAVVIGYIVQLVTTLFLWPYLTMAILAHGWRVGEVIYKGIAGQ